MPSVVEDKDSAAALHLLELPLVAARRYVPAAAAAANHLHVISAHLADRARLDELFELPQGLVEQIVLHHPQQPTVGSGCVKHALRACHIVAHRFLQVDIPTVAEQVHHPLSVKWRGQQNFDGANLEVMPMPVSKH